MIKATRLKKAQGDWLVLTKAPREYEYFEVPFELVSGLICPGFEKIPFTTEANTIPQWRPIGGCFILF